MAENLQGIVDENSQIVKTSIGANAENTQAYKEVAQSIHKIIDQIQKIEAIANSDARSVEEVASASEHLSKTTSQLDNELGRFKV